MRVSVGRDETEAMVMIGMTFYNDDGESIAEIEPEFMTVSEAPIYREFYLPVKFEDVAYMDVAVSNTDEEIWVLLSQEYLDREEYAFDIKVPCNDRETMQEYRYAIHDERWADKRWGPAMENWVLG